MVIGVLKGGLVPWKSLSAILGDIDLAGDSQRLEPSGYRAALTA
jgi:hypothetical protein